MFSLERLSIPVILLKVLVRLVQEMGLQGQIVALRGDSALTQTRAMEAHRVLAGDLVGQVSMEVITRVDIRMTADIKMSGVDVEVTQAIVGFFSNTCFW